MIADLRLAVRSLAKAPAFTLAAIVCLALGIGANTTVFSAVNGLLIRPLPFADPSRVRLLVGVVSGDRDQSFSYPDYVDYGDLGGTMRLAAFDQRSANLGGVDVPERVETSNVSWSLFPVLGLTPQLGRNIRPDEELDGRVVLLSDRIWRRRFAADTGVLGRSVLINGVAHTVIGVMGADVHFPEKTELWIPLHPGAGRTHRGWNWWRVIGRLQPGATEAQATAAGTAIARRLATAYPETDAGRVVAVEPFNAAVEREVGPMMAIMLGVVGCVLLIACANVANMLLARATARRREIAVRLALGAPRWRIVRQLVAESLVIALGGGALGLLIGSWGIGAIARALPGDLPYWMHFEVDRTVLALTAAASLAASLVFGLAPALQAAAPGLVGALKDGGARGAGAGRVAKRARAALVVAQLALSLVLLVGASLMMRSFLRLQGADPGYSPRGVLAFETSLQGGRWSGDSAVTTGYERIVAALAAIPGVTAAGGVSEPPGQCCSTSPVVAEGREPAGPDARNGVDASFGAMTPRYLAAVGMRLVAGREFDARDGAGAPRVAIVNQTFARREWNGASALGRRFRESPTDTTWLTVVGIAADVKQALLTDPPREQFWVPHAQNVNRTMTLALRTDGDPARLAPAVRAAVHGVDADLPITALQPMTTALRERNFQPRVYTAMFGAFAAAALLLAAVGLYGVIAYTVAQRTHEIGVRVALGAAPRDVRWLVVRDGARLALAGVTIGVPAAFALARVLRGALYGVSATDPLTFVVIPLFLTLVALVASWVPARRATRVEPVMALRAE